VITHETVTTKDQLIQMFKDLRDAKYISCDLETEGFDFWCDAIVGFAFGCGKKAWYIPVNHSTGDPQMSMKLVRPVVAKILEKAPNVVFHNAKFDCKQGHYRLLINLWPASKSNSFVIDLLIISTL